MNTVLLRVLSAGKCVVTFASKEEELSAESSADGSLAANVSETQACSLQAPEHHVHCTQCIYGDVN